MVQKMVVTLLLLITLVLMAGPLTGCVRRVSLYDNGAVLPIDFFNGFDMHAGANGVDTVDARRGTLPSKARSSGVVSSRRIVVDPE